jgi:hypothetical protein
VRPRRFSALKVCGVEELARRLVWSQASRKFGFLNQQQDDCLYEEGKVMSKWPRFCRRRLMIGVACGLLFSAFAAGEARAGILQISISEGATLYVILDEGPLDTLVAPPPDNINKIQALSAALVFPDYKIVGLNATTNNPGVSDPTVGANLVVGGEVQKLTGGAAPPLIITVTDTDYSLPGAPRNMSSISSTQFTGASAGDTKTFQSWYNPTNGPYDMVIPQSALPQSYSSTGVALNGLTLTSGQLGVPFAALYGLTNETVITMTGAGGDLVFGGSTLITSIPEPGSIALLASALPLLALAARRKRRV